MNLPNLIQSKFNEISHFCMSIKPNLTNFQTLRNGDGRSFCERWAPHEFEPRATQLFDVEFLKNWFFSLDNTILLLLKYFLNIYIFHDILSYHLLNQCTCRLGSLGFLGKSSNWKISMMTVRHCTRDISLFLPLLPFYLSPLS